MTASEQDLSPDIALIRFGQGSISWEDLVAYFKVTKFIKHQPTVGDYGQVYLRAEEGPDPFEGGPPLENARAARIINQDQYDELVEIVRTKLA